MAFQDKFRALMFGLPAGVPACELAGEKVLLFKDVPLELERALTRWLLLHDELLDEDSPASVLRIDARGRDGITWAGWGCFLDWMGAQLDPGSEGQGEPLDVEHALREGMAAGTPACALQAESVLYLDDAPVELHAALRRWLDAAPDLARHDDRGRVAIEWHGWQAFLYNMQHTLSAALDALESAQTEP
jgi:hypothetical protein